MAAVPIYAQHEDFYVPHFEVKIAGQALDPMVVRDVTQVTYKDKVDEIDSFEMVINNWDAQLHQPKYEPASNKKFERLFDPGQQIELLMGYEGNTRSDRLMLRGEITTIEPTFSESGPLSLAVRGLNVLHKFRKKQHTWAWPGADGKPVRDSDIAVQIGKAKVTDQKPGLGIEVRVDGPSREKEEPQPFIFMNNQYDIVFLRERAALHGYTVFLGIDDDGKEYLNFAPSESTKDISYELEWGKSLVEFRPTLTTARQISQVTVRGFDRKTGKAIEGTAKWGDKGLDINRDEQSVSLAVQGRHEVITDQPVYSQKEAQELAAAILRGQLQDMIKATGTSVGLPALRAGSRIVVKNLGPRFSGEYFVTETTHSIGDSGYKTTFGARREKPLPDEGGDAA